MGNSRCLWWSSEISLSFTLGTISGSSHFAGMGFPFCLSSCSSKDRHADVYVGEFLWYQPPFKCCLSFPSGEIENAWFLWNRGCALACWVEHMWLRLVAYRPWQLGCLGEARPLVLFSFTWGVNSFSLKGSEEQISHPCMAQWLPVKCMFGVSCKILFRTTECCSNCHSGVVLASTTAHFSSAQPVLLINASGCPVEQVCLVTA